MTDYGKVRSTVKPEALVIDDYSVWKATDIVEVSENVGTENEFVGYDYCLVQYDKNEFILQQAEDNAALETELTQTQVALAEVYEMMS